MKPTIVLSWLSYLTEENRSQRIDNYVASMQSLATFPKNVSIVIVDNSNIDEPLRLRDKHLKDVPIFLARNEFCDVAAHYVGSELAFAGGTPCEDKNDPLKYFAFSYDDFVFYDTGFFDGAMRFMDKHNDVACMRLTEYDVMKKSWYDTAHTPKTVNPEAVRHNNTPGEALVKHVGPFEHGGRLYYTSTWRPTSRPAMWHVGDFMKRIGTPDPCPTLQQFEQHMYERCDKERPWMSAFIDKGVCRTFPQETSLRIKAGLGITKESPRVNVSMLRESIQDRKNWK